MTASAGWDGLLDPGETILWQGQPEPGVRFEWDTAFEMIFMVFWTGFAVFWMIMASLAGGFFWMFGLLFFFIGMYRLVGVHFYKAWLRRETFYTLTSQRAFIATNIWGRKTLDSYPITEATPLALEESGGLMDIRFATRVIHSNRQTVEKAIGFVRLKDGTEVMKLMRQVQTKSVAQVEGQ